MYFRTFINNRRLGVGEKRSFVLLLICSVYIVMWPSLTSGMDSHHDGLVITTINFTKDALLNGGAAPFNQYGPLWSFSYSLLALPFSPESTLVVSRIITLTIYILTAICLYKITQKMKIRGLWPLVITLLLLTQPWTTGFGTTFLAWPSALSSFLLTLITYQIVKSLEKNQFGSEIAVIGFLVSCLIFSRLQIGVATLLLTLVFLAINRSRKGVLIFATTFLLTTSVAVGFLVSKGWFEYFLFDSIEFSFTYLQDQYSVNPMPWFTIFAALFFFLFIYFFDKRTVNPNAGYQKLISPFFYWMLWVSTLLIVIAVLLFPDLQNFLIRAVRRFWIGSFLGLGMFAILKAITSFKQKSLQDSGRTTIWLFMYGGMGMVQLYPLFDQVHFWWGLSPLVIPIAAFLIEKLKSTRYDLRNLATVCLVSLGIITVIVPSVQRALSDQDIYAGRLISLVKVSPESNLNQTVIQNFFSRSIDKGDRVLNLCHNSDVFFNRSLAQSSSRYFIYWPPFTNITNIEVEITNSRPDAIVTCSQSQVPLATEVTNEAQLRIITRSGFDVDAIERILLNGTEWKIFKK
jgi:hypothetical protein